MCAVIFKHSDGCRFLFLSRFPRYMAPEVIADEPRLTKPVTSSGPHESSKPVMSCYKVRQPCCTIYLNKTSYILTSKGALSYWLICVCTIRRVLF